MSTPPVSKKRTIDATTVSANDKKATDIIAIDIEGSGPNLVQHFMLEFAASLIKIGADKPTDTYYVSLEAPPNTTWSVETLADFWAKPDKKTGVAPIYALNERRAKNPKVKPEVAMDQFVDWIRARNAEIEARGGRLIIVSDTAGYDVKWIDYYLSHYSTKAVELAQVLGTYRPTRDISSFMIGIAGVMQDGGSFDAAIDALGLDAKDDWGASFAHSHDPASDAQHIAARASYIVTMCQGKQK